MAGEQNIFVRLGQRVKAFLTSRDALTFCFFVLIAAFIWFVHNFEKQPNEQHTIETTSSSATQYAEKTLTIRVNAKDVPDGKRITLLPNQVKVRFKAPCAQYDNIVDEDFQAECSFPKDSPKTLHVSVTCSKASVEIISTTPSEIEYIIN